MKRVITLSCIFLLAVSFKGSSQVNTSSFTVKDGLPSNHVYRCVEDNNGYLWVATDAGIARFDGKFFQVFTTDHGLPDNEVLSVVKENNGRIWVNCFRQSPAYFDEVRNKFINAAQDSNLAKVSGTTGMQLIPLQNGGVLYLNEAGSHVFKDNKLSQFSPESRVFLSVTTLKDGSLVHLWRPAKYEPDEKAIMAVIRRKNERDLDTISIRIARSNIPTPYVTQDKLYMFCRGSAKIIVFSNFTVEPFRCTIDTINTPEDFIHFDFTTSYYYLLGISGNVYVYDRYTNKLQKTISGNYLPNSYYSDSKGNDWISTTDKGLIAYRKMPVSTPEIPAYVTHRNFTSIAQRGKTILAGNYYGEIIEIQNDKFRIHQVLNVLPARQRKILIHKNDIYSISDQGIFVNYVQPVMNRIVKTIQTGKTGIVLNDSTIIIGYATGMALLNTKNNEIEQFFHRKRITTISKGGATYFYFGSTDGVYKYDLQKAEALPLNKGVPGHRVSAMATSPDGLLWVGTGGQGLMVLSKDTVLRTISVPDGLVDNTIRCMTAGRPGTVWVGTNKGISLITYRLKQQDLSFFVRNITANDGLASNEVNDMHFGNDTMYVATSDGISILPANVDIKHEEINLRISGIFVNESEFPILDNYILGSNQKNLNIRFSAVDLSGHFKYIQYRLNEDDNWTNLTGNTLNLQLNHGEHLLEARAIDVNGVASAKVLRTRFDIKVPFWKSLWFLAACFLLIQMLLIYGLRERKKKRTRIMVEKQVAGLQTASLEQQAFTSLMNPHFIFNALNSVQHYINLQDRQNANRYLSDFASLIRRNFEAAQKSFIPLEEELESIRIYLRLEQMRFKSRFDYTIEIGEGVDLDDWMVPTMIIQPLMENAILHGLMPSPIKGKLELRVQPAGSSLEISITDNGIGLDNSRRLRHGDNHKSRSTELIRKRLAALNHFANEPLIISVSPVSDDDSNPGYKTTIILPSNLYDSWKKAQSQKDLVNL